jgi:hypothetical protein
MSEVY